MVIEGERSPRPAVILVRPEGPLNVGLVARACANFDASLRLVNCRADLGSVHFRMTSVHAEHVVAQLQQFETLEEAVQDLDWVLGTCGLPRDPKLTVLAPREVVSSAAARGAGRVGLVFGNEAQGLSNAELRCCGAVVRIAAAARQPSLNLSHAVAVVLSALYQDPEHTRDEPRAQPAARHELDVLRQTWVCTMRETGYLQGANEARLPASLDRMFRRWGMLKGEVRTIMGLLRHLRERAAGNRTRD